MNCTEFEQLLDDAVFDRGLDSSARTTLKSHADACSSCQPKWSEFAMLDELIPRWNAAFEAKTQRDPVDLVDSVMFELANVDETDVVSRHDAQREVGHVARLVSNGVAKPTMKSIGKSSGARVSRRTGVGLTVICATTLAALVMLSLRDRSSKNEPLVVTSNQPTATNTVASTIEPAPPIDELLADAGNAYDFVATDTASMLADGASLFRPAGFSLRPSVDEPTPKQSTMRTMADEIPDRLERFGRGFKPISSGVSSATGFLFNVLPMGDAPPI